MDKPLSVTLGLQNLEYGDGFLIYDGVSDKRAVWTTPLRGFYAVKAVYETEDSQFDAFAAIVDDGYTSYESYLTDFTTRTGDRNLYGANWHKESQKWGNWDFGLFYREDDSSLDSDTLALSQRVSYTFDLWPEEKYLPQLTLKGEVVEQFGRTKVQNHALTASRTDRQSVGGHMDVKASFADVKFTPYVKSSYIYLPGDDPDTADNEAFDPMFYGFSDWGQWFIGSINSYNLFNFNQRTIAAEAGMYPSETTSLRAMYFYTDLDRQLTAGAGRQWSHEVNVIFDWYPNEFFFAGGEFGWAQPLKAAEAYAGDDDETTEIVLWAGVQF
jgi:hypothetical protein